MAKRKGVGRAGGISLGAPGFTKKTGGPDEGGGKGLGLGTSGKFPKPDRTFSGMKAQAPKLTPGKGIPHQVGASATPRSNPIMVQGGGNSLGGFFPTNSARNQQDRSVKSRTT